MSMSVSGLSESVQVLNHIHTSMLRFQPPSGTHDYGIHGTFIYSPPVWIIAGVVLWVPISKNLKFGDRHTFDLHVNSYEDSWSPLVVRLNYLLVASVR